MNQLELLSEGRTPSLSTNTIETVIESNGTIRPRIYINSNENSHDNINSIDHGRRPRLEINQQQIYINPVENTHENIDSIHNGTRPRIDMNQSHFTSDRRIPSGTENTLTNTIEPNGTRRSFRRTTSLPAYDEVISDETFAKPEETPPPNYNEITFSTIQSRRKRMAPLPPEQESNLVFQIDL